MVADMAAGCVIGVDLGGTKLLAGTVDSRLDVHHRAYRLHRPDDAAAVIDQLVEAVQEAIEAATEEVLAVGVGVPALVDPETGVALDSNHLPLRGVSVRDLLAERLGLPVVVDNDGNVALLAEHRAGAAKGASHAAMLTLGTGIGGALLVDGRLVRGASGAAGELGHIVVDLDGPPCPGNCPSRGCLEAVASGSALAVEGDRAIARDPSSALARAEAAGRPVTGALVTELAHDGDPAALAAIEVIGRRLGVGLASIANALNPEVIVIGGGVIAAGELLLGPAREELAARALPPIAEAVRIEPARFGAESGALGAALLARAGSLDA
jgi:glucokinase